MCCRYYYRSDKVKRILEDRGIGQPESNEPSGGIIMPGSESLMLVNGRDAARTASAVWGFPGKDGKLVINARSETAENKTMFRDALKVRRCILPAECFFEWDRDKNKVTFSNPKEPVIFLAGFWSLYGSRPRFVVLTTAANASMLPVHDRMPLMVPGSAVSDWLTDTSFAMEYLQAEMPPLHAQREYAQLSLFEP